MLLFLSKLFYRLGVNIYHLGIGVVSLFNEKAYRFTKGRINQEVVFCEEKSIWFHCASLGEFEQAKPLINWCYSNLKNPIILSFFSPSGYVYKNNYPLARAVYYLPKDTPHNAKEFIQKINPAFVFFIKYEFWYFMLAALKKQGIPSFLVAGIFRESQLFFKPYGQLHREMLQSFQHLFVQDEKSLELLQSIAIQNTSIAFDTRFDTVKQISDLNFTNEIVEEFIGQKKCLLIGSSWLKDDKLFKELIPQLEHYKIILAPHDVNPSRINQLQQLFPKSTLLSDPLELEVTNVLIIDSIGKLSLLYRYADICYIGGGFDASVHNVLEAAVYGKPLLFGPNHKKSKEALDLIELNCAIPIQHAQELLAGIVKFENKDNYITAAKAGKAYVSNRTGGTTSIMAKLELERVFPKIKTKKP